MQIQTTTAFSIQMGPNTDYKNIYNIQNDAKSTENAKSSYMKMPNYMEMPNHLTTNTQYFYNKKAQPHENAQPCDKKCKAKSLTHP